MKVCMGEGYETQAQPGGGHTNLPTLHNVIQWTPMGELLSTVDRCAVEDFK